MKYTIDELTAAKRQIDSTLHKLRETVKTFESKDNSERYKSQITLAKRRIKAFEIANYFRFLYKGIIINHNKKLSQPTLKRRFFKKKAAFFSWPGLGKEWC